jgi:hypothetical protein
MHETARILHAVSDRAEAELLQRWLEDEQYIRPYEARQVEDRARLRQAPTLEGLIQQARQAGESELAAQVEAALEALHLDADDDFLAGLSAPIYDRLSRVSHSRRSGMDDSVSVKLREIAMGPHPSWQIARHVRRIRWRGDRGGAHRLRRRAQLGVLAQLLHGASTAPHRRVA